MSTVYGILNASDTSTLENVGVEAVFRASQQIVAAHREELDRALTIFVQPAPTTNYKEIYKTLTGGRMQEVNEYGQPLAVKATGEYEVAYPLQDFQESIAVTRVTEAKMTLREYQRHLDNINDRHTSRMRYLILRPLLNNVNETWRDPLYGDLTLRRLANSDGTIYPPLPNAEDGAQDSHYLVSGYTSANISNTNNPIATLRMEVSEHLPGDLAVFINSAETGKITALADFVQASDPYIRDGANRDTIITPFSTAPGSYLGRMRGAAGAGTNVFEWDYIPSGYILMINVSDDAPLKKRVDPEEVLRGYSMIPGANPQYPLREAIFGERCGFGVAERTAAAVMQLKASGAYDIPSGYV